MNIKLAMAALAAFSSHSLADVLTAIPDKDNTLYESLDGSTSNGAGDSIFAGVTNTGSIRRSLLQFDLSNLPSSATITSASLQITQDRQGPGGAAALSLHRTTASWGQGASSGSGGGGLSSTNDATWIHRFYPGTLWTTPGGDFDPSVLGNLSASGTGNHSFASSPTFVSVVQAWVQDQAQNFGLLIKEANSTPGAAARFYSREASDPTVRPQLSIGFERLTTTWTANANGSWIEPANWSAGIPSTFGVIARFGNANTAPTSITLPDPISVGQLLFDSTHSYSIGGSGHIMFDNGTGFEARVDVATGTHLVTLPVIVNDALRVEVASSSVFRMSNIEGNRVTKSGAGALELEFATFNVLNLQAGVTRITSPNAMSTIEMNVVATASLDLRQSGFMQLSSPTGIESLFAQRQLDIAQGRITTSDAALTVGIARSSDLPSLNRAVPNSSILFRATFAGDVNLDGAVNFDDLLKLAQNYGLLTGADWVDGDSNRDGKVDFDDLLALAQKYGSSLLDDGAVQVDWAMNQTFATEWQRALTLAPEPTLAGALIAIAPCLRRRR
jgi:hypothetical protein